MNIIEEGFVKILEVPDTLIIHNAQDALELLISFKSFPTMMVMLQLLAIIQNIRTRA
jgi:hypothetical protein